MNENIDQFGRSNKSLEDDKINDSANSDQSKKIKQSLAEIKEQLIQENFKIDSSEKTQNNKPENIEINSSSFKNIKELENKIKSLEFDFQNTINLIEELKFINSYSFLFSPRPGTPSAKKLNMNLKLVKNRLEVLQKHLFDNQEKNNKNFVGKLSKILVENKLEKQEKFFGRNEYMIPVIFDSNTCKVGEIIDVEVLSYNKVNLFGKHTTKQIKAA